MELNLTSMNQQDEYQKYERAKKRVKEIKGFHNHLLAYLIVNIFLIVGRLVVLQYVDFENKDEGFQDWMAWNTYLMPILWGIGLMIHGLVVFKLKGQYFKNWEEKKIKEIMDNEEKESQKFWE